MFFSWSWKTIRLERPPITRDFTMLFLFQTLAVWPHQFRVTARAIVQVGELPLTVAVMMAIMARIVKTVSTALLDGVLIFHGHRLPLVYPKKYGNHLLWMAFYGSVTSPSPCYGQGNCSSSGTTAYCRYYGSNCENSKRSAAWRSWIFHGCRHFS